MILALFLTLCAPGPRDNCVVDGDTAWIAGEKIRFADLNAPEISQPQCPAERARGIRARDRLLELLNAGTVTLARQGRDKDRYGRSLRIVLVDGKPVGDVLIREGLARPWRGRSGGWC